jgi:hypothetical protein
MRPTSPETGDVEALRVAAPQHHKKEESTLLPQAKTAFYYRKGGRKARAFRPGMNAVLDSQ